MTEKRLRILISQQEKSIIEAVEYLEPWLMDEELYSKAGPSKLWMTVYWEELEDLCHALEHHLAGFAAEEGMADFLRRILPYRVLVREESGE